MRTGALKARRLVQLVVQRRRVQRHYQATGDGGNPLELHDSLDEKEEDGWINLHPRSSPQPAAATMTVFARFNGKTIAVQASRSETIRSLMSKVDARLGPLHGHQPGRWLCRGGTPLVVGRTLEDFNIQREDTIDVMLPLKGGFANWSSDEARLRHEAWQNANYLALQLTLVGVASVAFFGVFTGTPAVCGALVVVIVLITFAS